MYMRSGENIAVKMYDRVEELYCCARVCVRVCLRLNMLHTFLVFRYKIIGI